MNIRYSFLLLLVLTIGHLAAQVSGNSHYNQFAEGFDRNAITNAYPTNNEVVLKVNGLMNIVADNYVAVFSLMQAGETADITNQMMQSRITAFRQKLAGIGINDRDVTVDLVSFVPRYEVTTEKKMFSKSYNEVPVGFELQKNISVRYRNAAKLDEIVTAAAAAEIYDLVKADYYIPNVQHSLDSLRGVCLQAMRVKVRSFEAIDVRLDTQKKVMSESYGTVYPPARYAVYQAYARPSVSNSIQKSGAYQEAEKLKSGYYSPVAYDQYDIVINPVITEPVVQMSYTVSVKYLLPDDKKNNYYIFSPSGEMKPFNPR